MNILTYVALILFADAPFMGLNVFQRDSLAGVSLIAPEYEREQQAFFNVDVPEYYISDIDPRLSRARSLGVKGVKHTPRSPSIWLLLLLRAKVNCPPHRFLHCDVFIKDIGNNSVPLVSRISLDVDSLKGPLHLGVPKSNIPHAVSSLVRRH